MRKLMMIIGHRTGDGMSQSQMGICFRIHRVDIGLRAQQRGDSPRGYW